MNVSSISTTPSSLSSTSTLLSTSSSSPSPSTEVTTSQLPLIEPNFNLTNSTNSDNNHNTSNNQNVFLDFLNSHGDDNRSSIMTSNSSSNLEELVSPLDLTIIIFVLFLWATTILMCINKWGKIRMLEPYQPSFQHGVDDDISCSGKKNRPIQCKTGLNRSTIRIITSEADLVGIHENGLGGISCSAMDHSYTGLGAPGLGGGMGGSYGGREMRNIPRIEISPISWTDERRCKSLEDVRVRLLS